MKKKTTMKKNIFMMKIWKENEEDEEEPTGINETDEQEATGSDKYAVHNIFDF